LGEVWKHRAQCVHLEHAAHSKLNPLSPGSLQAVVTPRISIKKTLDMYIVFQ
jgi:hypothetical protein